MVLIMKAAYYHNIDMAMHNLKSSIPLDETTLVNIIKEASENTHGENLHLVKFLWIVSHLSLKYQSKDRNDQANDAAYKQIIRVARELGDAIAEAFGLRDRREDQFELRTILITATTAVLKQTQNGDRSVLDCLCVEIKKAGSLFEPRLKTEYHTFFQIVDNTDHGYALNTWRQYVPMIERDYVSQSLRDSGTIWDA
jgi:hypothetical protein